MRDFESSTEETPGSMNKSMFDFIEEVDNKKVVNLNSQPVQDYIFRVSSCFLNQSNEEILSLIYHQRNLAANKEKHSDSGEYNECTEARIFDEKQFCVECGEGGHPTYNCPKRYERNCVLCEGKDHVKNDCPRSFCHRCLNFGHRGNECREYSRRSNKKCNSCSHEHFADDCPRYFRTYLFNGKLEKNIKMSCNICFSKHHFSDDCKLNDRRFRFSIYTKSFTQNLKAKKYFKKKNN